MPARASPSSARRCFRRVSTSFLGSNTFWVDFFTSPWLLRENIPPREAWAPPAGQERLRHTSHRIGSGPARVARATHRGAPGHHRRHLCLSFHSRKEGPAGPGEGRGQEGGVGAERTAPPRGRRWPAPQARRARASLGRASHDILPLAQTLAVTRLELARRITKKRVPLARCTTSPGKHREKALQSGWCVFSTMGLSGL